MKRLLVFLLVFEMASPVAATVSITCSDCGDWTAEFIYDISGESCLVKAFALNITVDSGATIESIFDYKVGESTADDPGYGIFLDELSGIQTDDDGNITDWGTPVASPNSTGALPGLGTYGITIGMGALYDGSENAPLLSDTLFKITVAPHGASAVNIAIAEEITYRGGIIMEDGGHASSVVLNGCTLVPEPMSIMLLGLGGLFLHRRTK